jgi:hypothetical protein
MATNLAQILAQIARQGQGQGLVPRDQPHSFPPRIGSTLGRGPSPLGDAFLSGGDLVEQILSRAIAPARPQDFTGGDDEADREDTGNPVDRGLFGGRLGDLADNLDTRFATPDGVAKSLAAAVPGLGLFAEPFFDIMNSLTEADSLSDPFSSFGLGNRGFDPEFDQSIDIDRSTTFDGFNFDDIGSSLDSEGFDPGISGPDSAADEGNDPDVGQSQDEAESGEAF